MIKDIYMYKMLYKEINIKNRAYNYYENLVKVDDLQTKNTIIHEKSYEGLIIYFVRYILKKSIDTMSLYYIKNIEEYDGTNCLIVNDSVLNEVSGKTKKIIGLEEFDNTKT